MGRRGANVLAIQEQKIEGEREIVNLGPRDRIDIQSFIWVVGSYEKGREQPQD